MRYDGVRILKARCRLVFTAIKVPPNIYLSPSAYEKVVATADEAFDMYVPSEVSQGIFQHDNSDGLLVAGPSNV